MASTPDKAPVLAVDDTATNLAMLRAILRDECEVATATSGEEALEKLQVGPTPGLVLLPIMLRVGPHRSATCGLRAVKR